MTKASFSFQLKHRDEGRKHGTQNDLISFTVNLRSWCIFSCIVFSAVVAFMMGSLYHVVRWPNSFIGSNSLNLSDVERAFSKCNNFPKNAKGMAGKSFGSNTSARSTRKMQKQFVSYHPVVHYESLVHPAVITHPFPRRVAIIGSNNELTLREVLKHKTVKEVKIFYADELDSTQWSNCSHLVPSPTMSCFDDERVKIHQGGPRAWFAEIAIGEDEDKTGEHFDVIIMDIDVEALDAEFVNSLYDTLDEECGILAAHLGRSPNERELIDHAAVFKTNLAMSGFESIHVYEDGHSFSYPHSYLVAFADYDTRTYWFQNEADIEMKIQKRIHQSKSNKSSINFDAPTVFGYQVPHKVYERIQCKYPSVDEDCSEFAGFDPAIANIPLSHVIVRNSSLGEQAGRGLFALQDLPAGLPIGMEDHPKGFHVRPKRWKAIESIYEWMVRNEITSAQEEFRGLEAFVDGYGFASRILGEKMWTIDAGVLEFFNHGCNGTANYGYNSSLTEMNVDENVYPNKELSTEEFPLNYVIDRHIRQRLASGDKTTRVVNKGEEVFVNYLDYVGGSESWKQEVLTLRGQCNGTLIGEITQYEIARKKK